MFPPSDAPRVFGLPPGADFPAEFVAGLKERLRDQPPEAIARVTVYLNTSSMREQVRAAFRASGAGFLPRLQLVSDIGAAADVDLPPAMPPLRRNLELTRLVGGLMSRTPDFAPGTAVHDLAESLGALIDEMQDEDVAAEALEVPGLADDHAGHWQRSLTFLRLITPYLDDPAAPGPALRQRRAVESLCATWTTAPPADPVIVAGSTGSRGTTACLMRAVAELPQGALLLPGFDFDMPEFVWNSLYFGGKPDEDHPQFRFFRLLGLLNLPPSAVLRWSSVAVADPGRNRLVSLALRPAPVTDQWLSEGAALGPLAPMTAGLSLIEAPTPRAEAMAIALALRDSVETGASASLVTADRILARRVVAALDRWGIEPDDSAGEPLPQSPPGRLLRHVAGLFGRKVTSEAILVLLKHPITASGSGNRGDHLRLTRDLELHIRRRGIPFLAPAALTAWAVSRTDKEACEGWAAWVASWIADVPSEGDAPLPDHVQALVSLSERLAAGPGDGAVRGGSLWDGPDGRLARATVEELASEAPNGGTYATGAFSTLLARLLGRDPVRNANPAHPQIRIRGTREVRELSSDIVILAGLREGSWPQPAAPDPWLSRQMRVKVGLLLPERQIGLAAHDFQQAVAAPRVILSRSIRDDAAQTVPSRWLDRLTNLVTGLDRTDVAIAGMRERGQAWLTLAASVEAVAPVPPAPRPSPRPPVEARPRTLSVTQISRLIRDPYAIYARHVLRLRPLDPLRAEANALARGNVLHKIVERFVGGYDPQESPDVAQARLMRTAEETLEEMVPWPSAQRLWLARIGKIAARFVADEEVRRQFGAPEMIEDGGGIDLPGLGFRLTAQPDRIDQAEDGTLHIYDYKSGRPPTERQIAHFEKQMPLEAAMAERGAFPQVGPRAVSGATFVRLGGEGESVRLSRDTLDPEDEWQRLQVFIKRYLQPTQGFTSRRAFEKADDHGDYDHLARFGEWQASDPPEPEDVP